MAVDLLAEALGLNPDEARTPILNLLGVAQYVQGKFSGAAESIEKNLARGGPTGPHMDVFLAAAYAQMGQNFEAQAIIEKLQRTDPDFPAENWLGNFIRSENELQATMSKLYSLGLPRS
jgi:adenylate cyclase